MRIKIDENLPSRLVITLTTLGHDVDTVYTEQLSGHPDEDVWQAAQSAGRFLITQDLDFSDRRRFQPGTHHGVLLIRLRNPGRNALLVKVTSLFQNEAAEDWAGCFIVATERKLRVRRS